MMPRVALSMLNLTKDFAVGQQLVSQLAEPQRQRLKALRGDKRHAQFIAGRLLLAKSLTESTANSSMQWIIDEHPGAAPTISSSASSDQHHAAKFSLSHSDNVVGLAMLSADAPRSALLGIDIERLDPVRRLRTAQYFCNPEQLKQLGAEPGELAKRHYMTRL